jgi:hypothetical protein
MPTSQGAVSYESAPNSVRPFVALEYLGWPWTG